MKRLLAYLFIVLGFGIFVNDHAKANNYCIPKKVEYVFQSIYIFKDCYIYHKKVDLDTFVEFALTHPLQTVGIDKESPLLMEKNLKWLKKYLKENNISSSKLKKSIKRFKIANSKSNQTQKVAKKKSENLYIERMLTKQEKLDIVKGEIKIYKCSSSTGTHFQKDGCIGDYYKKELITNKGLLNFYLLRDYTNTQIAKAEPSQTQKVENIDLDELTIKIKANGIFLCSNKKIKKDRYFYDVTFVQNFECDKYNNSTKEISLSELIRLRVKYSNVSCNLYITDSDGPKCKRKTPTQDTALYVLGFTENDFNKYGVKFRKNTLFDIGSNYYAKLTNKTLKKKTQIAKAEPSQTQKVAKKTTYDWVAVVKHPKLAHKFIATRLSTKKKAIDLAIKKCHIQINKSLGKSGYNDCSLVNVYKEKNKDTAQIDLDDIAALIDKAREETQTVEEQVVKTSNKPSLTLAEEDKLKAHIFSCWSIPLGLPYNEDLLVRIKLKLDPDGSIRTTEIMDHARMSKPGQGFYKVLAESALRAIKNCQPLPVPIGDYERVKELQLNFDAREMLDDGFSSDTQIAKTETTVKPKKKVKVVKKEPKQEEFEPKKTNQDNEAPVIEVAEAITVDSQAYTLKGKVKDKSQIYLTINGRQVEVKKGKFELDRFSIDPDVAEELKIVAIDQWNNKSEKIVKVTIDLQSTDIAKVYEELKPNNVKVKTDKNKIAIIIGIEKYENLTNLDAKYANRDAKAFKTYATRALGIKPSNIKMLIDDKATRSQALKAFKLWLPKIAGKGEKDIHIFFAGHGLASDNGEDLYILPQDGESSLLEDTAISRVELISLINKVNPKSVTLFFDTCYSGQTRDERMLVASLRPIRIVADEQETPDNFTIFTASNYDQTSGSIEEAEHGMFSYYLMKGLEGYADENKDKKITNGELITYLKDNVSQEAFTQNRQQDPMLAGDPDKILIKF